MDKTTLGDRMKRYESVSKNYLMRKTPVIMRLDGKAFHTYTKQRVICDEGVYSQKLRDLFTNTTYCLFKEMQGSRLAYMQSDEVSILLTDWRNVSTDAWFSYNVQKMVSVASSIFTYYFNETAEHNDIFGPALFDARVFNVPLSEVTNYFIWRQQDATRNSINMLGQSKFSHKELQGKTTSQVQDMLMEQHNINWNDIPTIFKRGSCIVSDFDGESISVRVDNEIPIFTQDRDYIEKHLQF